MYQQNALRIVCIGGGTGLSTLLRGLKRYINAGDVQSNLVTLENLTAIVSVSDDGGSSGKLIDEFGVLPPGDIRNCLVALSDEDKIMTRLFEHRFEGDGHLAGHSVGNLLLCALVSMNNGSFSKAISIASKVLAVKGRILPATLESTILCAELANGEVIKGESLIPKRKNREPIKRVYLSPRTNSHGESQSQFVCKALDEAVEAIESADAVILGPGSLYTSIIPNLLVEGIAEALKSSSATKIYVCNVMTEPGETDHYSISDHVQAILSHADFQLDYVLANRQRARKELLDQYLKEQLSEQFASIKQHAEEAIGALQTSQSDTSVDFENLKTLSARIKALSNTIQPSRLRQDVPHDANSIQVFFNQQRDNLGEIKLQQEDLLCEINIVERGIRKTVLRHHPERLAHALINLLAQSR